MIDNFCLLGMEQIIRRSTEQKAKVASVLLFTDGLANRGIKTPKEIIDAMRDPLGSLARPGVMDNAAGAIPLVSISLFGQLYIVTINRFQGYLIKCNSNNNQPLPLCKCSSK